MKKFESERNILFSVILEHTLNVNHLANVILGLVPRIHVKSTPMDTRVTPEHDREQSLIKGLDVVCQCAALLERRVQSSTRVRKAQAVTRQTNECIETAESGVDKVVSSCEKNPNVHKTYMNFLRQRKTALDAPLHAVSSGRLLPQCAPDATGFLSDVYKRGTRARKFLVDGVQCGRSMIEMLGVLAIIGVLSVGGIAGYSKAMMQFKINKTAEQISQIVTNLRTLYIQQKDFEGLNILNAISMGVVPDDLDINASRGEWDAIKNVFGGSVYISAHPATGFANYNNEFGAANIDFFSIPTEACIALATMDWGSSASSGLLALTINDNGFSSAGVNSGRGCSGEIGTNSFASACPNGSVVSIPMPVHIAAKACQGYGNSGEASVNFLFEK